MAGDSASSKVPVTDLQTDSPLSEERIVAAARHLMETSGMESVTMRRVASALGVTAMALYHHVADKQALVALVADHLIGAAPDPGPQAGPWHERLRQGFLAVHEKIVRYPGIGLHILGTSTFYPSGVRKLEHTLSLLMEAGFDEDEALEANYLLLVYQAGYFLMEKSVQRPNAAARADDGSERDGATNPKAAMNSHRTFIRGLDTIIVGLRAQLAAKHVLRSATDC